MQGNYEERYAAHPYVTGFIEGYEIDFVPCYDIKDSEQLKSAVDRTILHTEYIKKNLKIEQLDEILLLKKFMESIKTYGAEFKVGGFSGYLCELLILYYNSFKEVLNAAANEWLPNYKIDLEKYRTGELFSEPLVVIDPTDKNRNVSAALTIQKMSEFIVAARKFVEFSGPRNLQFRTASGNFIESPSDDYFFQKIPEFNLNYIKNELESRGTKTFLLIFKSPEVPADALYPQIKKTENSLRKILEREDFKIFNSSSWTDENNYVIILLEFAIWKLPGIKKHYGPYVWSWNHQKKFLDKYKNKAYVEEDRLVAEIERRYKDVESLLRDILVENKIEFLKFGKHIKNEILKEHQIMDILEFLGSKKCNEDMMLFFYEYLNKNVYLWR